jgi:hypothetical protein
MLETAADMLAEVSRQAWRLQDLLYDEFEKVALDRKATSEILVLIVRSQVGPLTRELGKVTAVLNALLMEMESADDDAAAG